MNHSASTRSWITASVGKSGTPPSCALWLNMVHRYDEDDTSRTFFLSFFPLFPFFPYFTRHRRNMKKRRKIMGEKGILLFFIRQKTYSKIIKQVRKGIWTKTTTRPLRVSQLGLRRLWWCERVRVLRGLFRGGWMREGMVVERRYESDMNLIRRKRDETGDNGVISQKLTVRLRLNCE